MFFRIRVALVIACLTFGSVEGFFARSGVLPARSLSGLLSLRPKSHIMCAAGRTGTKTPKHTSVIAGGLLGLSVLAFPVPMLMPSWNGGNFGFVTQEAVAVAADKDYTKSKYPLFEEVWDGLNENFFDDQYNGQDWQKVKKETLGKLDSGADEHAIVKKILTSLGDKYTRLVDKKTFEGLFKYDAIGVGLLFQSNPGEPLRVSGPPTGGSSSAVAGMKKGDLILSLNGKSTEDMTAMTVLDMMSNDVSPEITLEYYRPGADDTIKSFKAASQSDKKKSVTLARSGIEKAQNPISYSTQRLAGGKLAGYIRFSDFNAEAVPNLHDAILDLEKKGVDELLMDLRGNTGGGFQFALNIGGMFMGDRPMVTTKGKAGDSSSFRTSYPEGQLTSKPLVILTDGLSASASEVLTGGLVDNCRAVTAGANTFGKGKIQAVFGLANGEGLVMTVAQYVTPKGTIIQSRGIPPALPGPAGNAYLNLAISSTPANRAPDLEAIDFNKAQELLKTCTRPDA